MSALFQAEKREKFGSSESRRIRKCGRLPAVIYSKEGNVNLSLSVTEFEREYFKGGILTTVAEIEFGGKKIKVIAHKVELDPVSDRPVHVDFLSCEESKSLRAKPKLVFVNQEKSSGLKKGGFLHVAIRAAYPGSAADCKDGAGGFAGAAGNSGAWPWPNANVEPSKDKPIVRICFEVMNAALRAPTAYNGFSDVVLSWQIALEFQALNLDHAPGNAARQCRA